eukprot:1157346-Pelagomonas_calceolata.AAC.3
MALPQVAAAAAAQALQGRTDSRSRVSMGRRHRCRLLPEHTCMLYEDALLHNLIDAPYVAGFRTDTHTYTTISVEPLRVEDGRKAHTSNGLTHICPNEPACQAWESLASSKSKAHNQVVLLLLCTIHSTSMCSTGKDTHACTSAFEQYKSRQPFKKA